MDTRIEEYLATIESAAAPTYEALLRAEIPSKGDQARADFATFLALMYVRTPAMRRMSGELFGRQVQIMNYAYGSHDMAFEGILKRAEKDGLPKLDEAGKARLRENLIDPTGYVMQVRKETTLRVLGAVDELSPLLLNMTWSVVDALQGFFITTDNPLVREVNPKTRHPILGDHGFNNKTAEVFFPLSPRRLLLMTWREDMRPHGGLERDQVDRVNIGMAAQSDQYLYAHVRDKRLERLASEFKNSRPGMTTQGFGPENFAEIEVPRKTRR